MFRNSRMHCFHTMVCSRRPLTQVRVRRVHNRHCAHITRTDAHPPPYSRRTQLGKAGLRYVKVQHVARNRGFKVLRALCSGRGAQLLHHHHLAPRESQPLWQVSRRSLCTKGRTGRLSVRDHLASFKRRGLSST
jgi:hypothetical protein